MILEIVETIFRTSVAYIVLLLLSRIIGRKLISQVTFFDFVVGLTFGSLAVHISLDQDSSWVLGIVSSITITILVLLTDFMSLKSALFHKIEEGEPIVLIQQGKLLNTNLRKTNMCITDLLKLLREKDVFNICDVDYAIIENDGKLSILLKAEKLTVTKNDMKITPSPNTLPLDLVMNGKLIKNNLATSGYDKRWLMEQINNAGIPQIEHVFYAGLDTTGTMFIFPYHSKLDKK
jgi:Predicted membrane protein